MKKTLLFCLPIILLTAPLGALDAKVTTEEPQPINLHSITITSPNEGAFKSGQVFNATWTRTNLPPTALMTGYLVPVVAYTMGNKTALFSAKVEDFLDYYSLTLPFALYSDDYKFRVEITDATTGNSIASDESDGIISIIPGNGVGATVKVITPNGGETFIDGEPVQISWESVNAPVGSTVGLSLGGLIGGIGGMTNGTSGTMTWVPRVFRQSGETYKITAELFAPGAVRQWNSPVLYEDSSDSAFTINLPPGTTRSLTVISPTGTNVFQAGRSFPITWQTSGISTNAQILLTYKQFGTSTELSGYDIATVSNSGSYAWTVPANTSTSPAQWRIEAYYVTENRFYGAQAESAYFTITPPLTLKNFRFIAGNANFRDPKFQLEVRGIVRGARCRIERSTDLKQWETYVLFDADVDADVESTLLSFGPVTALGAPVVPPAPSAVFPARKGVAKQPRNSHDAPTSHGLGVIFLSKKCEKASVTPTSLERLHLWSTKNS